MGEHRPGRAALSLQAARAAFEQAAAIADAHDLVLRRLRATHGSARSSCSRRAGSTPRARSADRCGALLVAAVLDLQPPAAISLPVARTQPRAKAADTARRLHFPASNARNLFRGHRPRARRNLAAHLRGVGAATLSPGIWCGLPLAATELGCANGPPRPERALERPPQQPPARWAGAEPVVGLWPLLRALRGADARRPAEAKLVPVRTTR